MSAGKIFIKVGSISRKYYKRRRTDDNVFDPLQNTLENKTKKSMAEILKKPHEISFNSFTKFNYRNLIFN